MSGEEMKIAVIGSRTFNDYNILVSAILKSFSLEDIDCIISGGARGADSLAERFSREYLKKEPVIFRADWDTHGKSAGFIRNTIIINNAGYVIAFWDGKSTGTLDSIKKAYLKGLKVEIINF